MQTMDEDNTKNNKNDLDENEGTYLSYVHICFSVLFLYFFYYSYIILTYYNDFATWSRSTAPTKETGQAKQTKEVKEEKEANETKEKKEIEEVKELGSETQLEKNLVHSVDRISHLIRNKQEFQDEMTTLFKVIQLTELELKMKYDVIYNHVQEILTRVFPKCTIHRTGSTMAGLALKNSDLDLVMNINDISKIYSYYLFSFYSLSFIL
jgi:DNA polymerase sigma